MTITQQYLESLQTNQFYIVVAGWNSGVYGSWKAAQEQTDGFSNNQYEAVKGMRLAVETLITELERFSIEQKLTADQQQTLNSCKKLLEDWGPPEVFPSII